MIQKSPRAAEQSGRRIAYLLGTFPALTETFVLREIGALRRRGMDVVVMAIRRADVAQHPDLVRELGASVPCTYARPDSLLRHALANLLYLIRSPGHYMRGLAMFLRQSSRLTPRETLQLLYHFFVGVGFSRDMQRRGISHAHSHFTSAANVGLAIALAGNASFSFTAHASNDLFVRPMLLAEKTALAQFVVAVCEYSRRYLDAVTGFRFSEKICRIYNGIDLGEYEKLASAPEVGRERSRSHPEIGRIVSVGSLVAPKGHGTLIQACARLRAEGQSFHCRIIGEGPERETLERLISAHRLQGSVELLGALSLDKVYTELTEADVFVLLCEIGPSGYRDGFPTAILEAMATGLPVLSTSLSGIPEMVLDGVTGKLVAERDVEGASEALLFLLGSMETRRGMGEAGRARVCELFDLKNSVDQLARLLVPTAQSLREVTAASVVTRDLASGVG